MKFPVVLKNTTDSARVIGGLWFPPNDTLVVHEHVYQKYKKQLDSALSRGVLVVEEGKKEKKTKSKEPEVIEIVETPVLPEEAGEDLDPVNESIIDLYAKKEVHWKTVEKVIKEINDVNELDKLLHDAYYQDLAEDNIVFRLINERMAELDGK